MKEKGFGYTGRLRVLLGLAFRGFVPDPKFVVRYSVFLGTAVLISPLKVFERLKLNSKIKKHKLNQDPIFVLGHMRSGTTHLHNLLSQDDRFSFPTTFQSHAPEFYVYGEHLIAPLFKFIVPEKRPMDNMDVAVDLPQEEEFAVCATSRHSFFYHMLFPKKADYFFQRYVLMDGLSERDLSTWKRKYDHVIRKFDLTSGQKRLILKNPVNTGRSAVLYTMYPGSVFIFIHRDPYEVFMSTRNLYRKVMPLCQLQSVSWEEVDKMILTNYVLQMERYFEDRKTIPSERLIEVRYSDLENDPTVTLSSIYAHLGLPDIEHALPGIEKYMDKQKDYQKNTFSLTDDTIQQVNEHCSAIFQMLGYAMKVPGNERS